MAREKEIIQQILNKIPRGKGHLTNFFESDAELIDFSGVKILFTTDEFSKEDLFRDDDPFTLGWNVVVCTMSDILASGGTPRFYAHSMQVSTSWSTKYIGDFSTGISSALKSAGGVFIGGDFGVADSWHYTGICLGEPIKHLSRKGALPGDIIFMTGEVGAGNLEAALSIYADNRSVQELSNKYKTSFKLRLNESALINQFATSCIDTSDGVLNALNSIADINKVGYEVSDLPYLTESLLACQLFSKPPTLFFMGECGEYELLFTIKKRDIKEFLLQAEDRNFRVSRIGEVKADTGKVLIEDNRVINFDAFNISARSYRDIGEYLEALFKFFRKLRVQRQGFKVMLFI